MTSVEPRFRASASGIALAFAFAFVAGPARAALGGDAASIEQDRARLSAQHLVAPVQAQAQTQAQTQTQTQTQAQAQARAQGLPSSTSRLQEHRLVLSDGSVVREFSSPGGPVFAIAWSTRLKPRLDALLGAQADRYASATRRAQLVPGARHALSIDEGDLVVHATTRLNSHVGFAYLRSLVPAGLSVDALR